MRYVTIGRPYLFCCFCCSKRISAIRFAARFLPPHLPQLLLNRLAALVYEKLTVVAIIALTLILLQELHCIIIAVQLGHENDHLLTAAKHLFHKIKCVLQHL